MRAAIAQPHDRVLVGEHRLGRGQVVVGVVDDRCVEEIAPAILDQNVVGDLWRRAPRAIGHRLHGVLGLGQIVDRIAEPEHLRIRQPPDQRERRARDRVLRQNATAHVGVLHRHDALGQRLACDRLVGRRAGERILAALEAQQNADGAWRKHGPNGMACLRRLIGVVQQLLPHPGALFFVALRQREHGWTPAPLDHAAQHREFRFRIGLVPIRHHLEEAAARIFHAERYARQLFLVRPQRRRVFAGQALVADRARRGKSESAGADRILRNLAHGGDVDLGRLLVPDGAVAHDVDAHRSMRQQCTQIDIAFACGQRCEVFAKRLPGPLQALVHDGARDILDAFHQLDEFFAILRLARREADAAVAHHRRGNPVPCRGRRVRVPHGLSIVMRMNIDESRRHDAPLGIHLLRATACHLANRRDSTILDPDIALARRRARAIDDRAIANDEIEFVGHCSVLLWVARYRQRAAGVGRISTPLPAGPRKAPCVRRR